MIRCRAPGRAEFQQEIFQRKDIARPGRNQNQFHKEAMNPRILSDDSWFPGFLIKKSSRNVTLLGDSTVKEKTASVACSRFPHLREHFPCALKWRFIVCRWRCNRHRPFRQRQVGNNIEIHYVVSVHEKKLAAF